MAHQTVTVAVPQPLYDHLKQRAAESQRSIEDEVVLALAEAVSDQGKVPGDLAATLVSLATLDDAVLWHLALSRVAAEDAERLAALGDQQQRSGVTDDERREAEELVRRHDRVLVVRAEAAVQLKRRGHDVRSLIDNT